MGINLEEREVEGLVESFGCRKGELPFDYLGMKVGGSFRRLVNWKDLVERVRSRLCSWKANSLSMGGRVSLINSVLSAIPIYRLAFAPIPRGIAKEFRSIQRKFMWGEEEEGKRKISWLKWEEVCKSKKEGGLGVKNLEWFNSALLGKWVWRFAEKGTGLWARVLQSRHGIDVGRRRETRESIGGGGWWSQVRRGTELRWGDWFYPFFGRIVGNGMDISFWEDCWRGESSLKTRFPRLFHLSANSGGKLGEMGAWADGKWMWELRWRRGLNGRDADEARDLEAWLEGAELRHGVLDGWGWGPERKGFYSVSKGYKAVEACVREGRQQVAGSKEAFRLIWRSSAPHKQRLMGWRTMHNALPTKDNLIHKKVIVREAGACICCGEANETAVHLFLRCRLTTEVWGVILRWIGIEWAAPEDLVAHFIGFSQLLVGKRKRRALSAVWLCFVWVVWNWRNALFFDNRGWDSRRIEEEIKCRLWSWFSVSNPGSLVCFRDWLNNRLVDYLNRL